MKEIKLTRGFITLVDDEDYEYLKQFKWIASSRGYVVRGVWMKEIRKVKHLLIHRVIMNAPDNLQVDHIDHNKLNNQKYNLRICTRSQNAKNPGKHKNTFSIYLGVSIKNCYGHKYIFAQISCDNKKINIGHFKTEIEAAIAYDNKAKELFGEFANLNFK